MEVEVGAGRLVWLYMHYESRPCVVHSNKYDNHIIAKILEWVRTSSPPSASAHGVRVCVCLHVCVCELSLNPPIEHMKFGYSAP